MIPLGHNRPNGADYSKINVKVEICSALRYNYDSHPMFNSLSLIQFYVLAV